MNKLDIPKKYIGIPFVENGKDFSGVDCIHLAQLYVENELGIKVTHMPPDIKKAQKNHNKYYNLLESILFHELIPGDIPFFAFPEDHWHCGIYVGYGKILHTIRPIFKTKKATSMIVPILPQWQPYYIGAIRTKGKKEIIVPDAGDPGTIATIAFIISVITTIYSVVSALTAPKPNFGNDSGSPKYGFDAISNTISNELIYPIHFGRNKYGGNIIWYKNSGDITYRIIVLGIGPVESITDVRINDIPIADCPGCSYTAYLGTPNQTVDSRAGGEVKGLRNIAHLAVTIQSSDKVPGGDPTVTCIVEGLKIKTWNGATWSGSTYSRIPAVCLRHLLIMPREDGGAGVDETEIDDASFGEVYDYQTTLIDNGAGGTHARHQCDFIFDSQKPIQDALKELLQPYGMFLSIGEKISLKTLKSESVDYVFTMDNIDVESFEYWEQDINESFNEVIVKYSDPDQNDVAIDAKATNQVDQVKNGLRSQEFSFLSLSRFAEASRRAEFIKNESNINVTFCSFNVDIDALHVSMGSVVTVTHDVPEWTDKLFRVINIEEEYNFKKKLTLKEENSSIYNDAFGSVIDSYDYGSPPNPYAPVTNVTSILLTEGGYYLHKDGKVGSDINISWTAPTDNTKKLLKEYIIELKKGAADYIEVGRTSTISFTIFGVEDEITYYVRIKTVSTNDIVSTGTISSALTVLGKLNPPSNVTGFEVYQEGNLLKFSWDPATDVDIARYEIRKGSEWATGTFVAEKVDVTEFMCPVGEIGNLTFMIKAFDTSGNESVAPGIDVINVIPPPDMNFVNTFDRWSKPFEYKLTNLELIQANYHNAGYVRPCLGLRTAITWEEREAEGKTWEQQEADGGLMLDGTVESSGSAEMAYPLDLETIFEFKLVIDADYKNVTGGSVVIQISYSEDGITYTSFADIDSNISYRARYLKFKIILATSNTAYNIYLYDLTIYINAPTVKKAWIKDVLIPIAGYTFNFGAGFTIAPRLKGNIVNGVVGVVIFNNKTKDQADVKVYDMAGSAIGTAEADLEAQGQ